MGSILSIGMIIKNKGIDIRYYLNYNTVSLTLAEETITRRSIGCSTSSAAQNHQGTQTDTYTSSVRTQTDETDENRFVRIDERLRKMEALMEGIFNVIVDNYHVQAIDVQEGGEENKHEEEDK